MSVTRQGWLSKHTRAYTKTLWSPSSVREQRTGDGDSPLSAKGQRCRMMRPCYRETQGAQGVWLSPRRAGQGPGWALRPANPPGVRLVPGSLSSPMDTPSLPCSVQVPPTPSLVGPAQLCLSDDDDDSSPAVTTDDGQALGTFYCCYHHLP